MAGSIIDRALQGSRQAGTDSTVVAGSIIDRVMASLATKNQASMQDVAAESHVPLPKIGPEHPYASQQTQVFKKFAEQGPESLSEQEQQFIKNASEHIPGVAEWVQQYSQQQEQTEQRKAITSVEDFAVEFSEMMVRHQTENLTLPSQFLEYTDLFLRAVGDQLSLTRMLGDFQEPGAKVPEGSIVSQEVADALRKGDLSSVIAKAHTQLGLEPVKPGDRNLGAEKLIKAMGGESEELYFTTGQATAQNFVRDAIAIAPQLLAAFMDNPYEFWKGIVQFPIEQTKVILAALGGWDIQPGEGETNLIASPYTDEEIEQARDELIAHPIGPLMLALMAAGIGARGKAHFKKTSDWVTDRKQVQRLREQYETGKATREQHRREDLEAAQAKIKAEDVAEAQAREAASQQAQLDLEAAERQAGVAGEGAQKPTGPVSQAVHDAAKETKLEAETANRGLERVVDALEATKRPEMSEAARQQADKTITGVRSQIAEHKALIEEATETLARDVSRETKEVPGAQQELRPAREDAAAIQKRQDHEAPVGALQKGKPQQKAEPVERLEAPEVIETGNTMADASRNLGHQKQFVRSVREAIDKTEPGAKRQALRQQYEEALKDERKYQAEFDRLRDEAEIADQAPSEIAPAEAPATRIEKLESIKVDPQRFQNRKQAYAEETVKRIMDDYQPAKFDPVVVWKDPKTGEWNLLSGHSRYEAMRRMGKEDIPVREFEGTPEQAVHFARVEANRLATRETLLEDISAYKQAIEAGSTAKAIENVFGRENLGRLDAYSNLNQGGKFMDIVTQRAFEDYPYAAKWARAVGELRKRFPELTDRHEQQIFDALYPKDKATGLYNKLVKDDLFAAVDRQVSDVLWNPDLPIRLKREAKPMTGPRADPNAYIRQAQSELDRLQQAMKENQNLIKDPAVLQTTNAQIQKQIEQLRSSMKDAIEQQYSMELGGGAFGTPQTWRAAYSTIYSGVEGMARWTKDIIDRSRARREVKVETEGGVRQSLQFMAEHHRGFREGQLIAEQLRATWNNAFPPLKEGRFAKGEPSPRWRELALAVELGPGSKFYDNLVPHEKAMIDFFRKESRKLEDFVTEHDIMNLPPGRRPPGQAYLYHWIVDPKTHKPFAPNYGMFARTGPQMRTRKHQTILDVENAGHHMQTYNVGALLGEAWKTVTTAFHTREMVRGLNSMEAPPHFKVTVMRQLMGEMVETQRPAGMLESWATIKESGLESAYTIVKDDRNVLSRELRLPLRDYSTVGPPKTKGVRIVPQKVGVLNELHPFVQAYLDSPTYGKFAKFMFAAKGSKLFGMFHPAVLMKQAITIGRNPLEDLIKGKRLIAEMDETMALLRKNGLNISGFEDIGFNTKTALRIESERIPAQILNGVLAPLRGTQHVIFEVIHPRLKAAFTHDVFQKQWPRLREKGLTRDQAAREVVRMGDELFSGEDYKMALLESSQFAAKYYYGATARKVWQMLFLSPTWQVEHLRMFFDATKSAMPKQWQQLLYEHTPSGFKVNRPAVSPIANKFRHYLAGALTVYAGWDMYNWVMTKHMDGDGRHMYENPKGYELAVRAPFDNPDSTTAWFSPMKSIMEVPGAVKSLFVDHDFHKFLSKVNPFFSEAGRTMFGIDDFGEKKYEDFNRPNVAKQILDWQIETWEPISINVVAESMKRNKAPLGSIISMFSFPFRKGYPGGEWAKRLRDYRVEGAFESKEAYKKAKDMWIAGERIPALFFLQQQGVGDQGIANFAMGQRNHVMKEWKKLSKEEQFMYLIALAPEERYEFYGALQTGGKKKGN